jgi:aryl-alcohol dehydrogenase-like predicted oxidoreductase
MGVALLEVTASIVGARYPSQIEETAAAVELKLSREDIAGIDLLLNKRQKRLNLS